MLHNVSRGRRAGWAGALAALAFGTSAAFAVSGDTEQIEAAAARGSVTHEVQLAAMYLTGNRVPQDAKKAAYWYEKAADAGDPAAENEIGYFYQAGVGVAADPARAVHWYQLAVASGLVKAKVNLGVSYLWGLGVRKDEAMAARLFEEAARGGDGVGATYLGNCYFFGRGVQQDRTVAEKWYDVGLRRHDPVAAFDVAALFSVEPGHSRDLPRAAQLLRTSVAAGYVPAMSALGLLLVRNPELAQSPEEALTNLEAGSKAGAWRASMILGVLHRDGRGTARDLPAARYDFELAALQGGDEAQAMLRNDLRHLAQVLSAEQVRTAVAEAKAWHDAHPQSLVFTHLGDGNWTDFPGPAMTLPGESAHAGQFVLLPPSS